MQIFAHRGFSLQYPENTMTAFRKALEVGADGIEMDARLTLDGQIVIMHDSTIDRTTNGKGKVRDLPLKEILGLDAGIKKGVVFENERVPTLEQVFAELGGKLLLNISFKRLPLVDKFCSVIPVPGQHISVRSHYGKTFRRVLNRHFLHPPVLVIIPVKLRPDCDLRGLHGWDCVTSWFWA